MEPNKTNINREGGRGESTDSISSGAPKPQKSYAFFGSADGRNDDTQNKPEVKAPSTPTLGSY